MHPMVNYWSFDSVLSHIFWFILLVVLIVAVARYAMGRPFSWRGRMMHRHMMGQGGALSVLRERYAKGEIEKEEYEEKKKVLME